jgi:hypothetical protein
MYNQYVLYHGTTCVCVWVSAIGRESLPTNQVPESSTPSNIEPRIADAEEYICDENDEKKPALKSRSYTTATETTRWATDSLAFATTRVNTTPAPSSKVKAEPAEPLGLPTSMKVTFFSTFDGISEISTGRQAPKSLSLAISAVSFVLMIGVLVLCFWQEGWFSLGVVMVLVGYVCLVLGVSAAGFMILSSCDATTLSTLQKSGGCDWVHGVTVVAKSHDSMDTSGSTALEFTGQKLKFETVRLKAPGAKQFALAWVVSIFVTLSFICYYLGLRSSPWWLGVSHLLICLVAAFLRSVGKGREGTFTLLDTARVDQRCCSTGILDAGLPSRIPSAEREAAPPLDLRIYSPRGPMGPARGAELVAWQVALLCREAEHCRTRQAILGATGMRVFMSGMESLRDVFIVFDGGVVTDEGLAFPNTIMGTSFQCSPADLAAPTPLLVRATTRQAQWSIENTDVKGSSLPSMGGLYITAFDMFLTWWLVSDERNDMGDMRSNLHGSFILISTAFYIALWEGFGGDKTLWEEFEAVHAKATDHDRSIAKALTTFLADKLS